jgi:iron complex outermembrane receptor protein
VVSEITFKNIFGYRKVDNSNDLYFDGSPFSIYHAPENIHEKQYSEEFQVLGKALDSRLAWILGAYYFRETGNETQRSTITVIPQDLVRTGFVKNISKSLFAQGTYDLGFVEGLSLTAGSRYTWDDRQLQQIGRNLLTNRCSSPLASVPDCTSPVFNANFGALTYTVGLDWKFWPNKLIYVVHRRGYRSGGFNLRANTAVQFAPFDPEFVKDVEVGLKADWDIGSTKLRTNLAAYYQWYTNIQRNVTFVDPGSNSLVTSVINAANAHVSGFEAEIRWLPFTNLEISGNVAHSALRYDKFRQALAGGAVQDLSANRVSFAPEWTGGGSVRFTRPLPGVAGSLALQGDVYSQSRMELQDLNVVGGIAAAYTIANFRVEWNNILGTRISVASYLRNAFDRTYFNGGFAINGLGPISKQYAPPRTYGLEVNIPFGD